MQITTDPFDPSATRAILDRPICYHCDGCSSDVDSSTTVAAYIIYPGATGGIGTKCADALREAVGNEEAQRRYVAYTLAHRPAR